MIRESSTFGDVNKFTSKFDYAMVFPNKKEGENYLQSREAKHCIDIMLKMGLELFIYNSVQQDELYVMIFGPDEVLKKFADKIDFLLPIDQTVAFQMLKDGDPEKRIKGIEIKHMEEVTPLKPFDYLYLRYDEDVKQELYLADETYKTFLTPSVRLKLIFNVLTGPTRDGGCDIEIGKLQHKGRILAFFPLHVEESREEILAKSADWNILPWALPFEEMRNYYGEKVTLYPVFLGHYTKHLIVPSLVGMAFQLVVWVTNNTSHPVLPFFGLFISIWAISFVETWKRKESKTALEWGMSNFEEAEIDRPEFNGRVIESFINGKPFAFFSSGVKTALVSSSFLIIGVFVLMVIGVVAGIYTLRYTLQPSIGDNASTVASVLNAVQITILNMVYQAAARSLTDMENHRTDTQYEDSMISKLFMFQFVNSYASFFYIAFIASYLPPAPGTDPSYKGQCGNATCMFPLMINLAVIFGSRLIFTNALELIVPHIQLDMKRKAEQKDAEHMNFTTAETEYVLLPYDELMDSIQNYADTAIQFGFMTMFTTALPIATFFSMVNGYVKVKMNAYKLAKLYQRPTPTGVQDIGAWQTIFTALSVAASITNAGIVCFTMNVLDTNAYKFTYVGRLWIFLGFQWTILGIQYLVVSSTSDKSDIVDIQLKRIAFIGSKIMEKQEDEDFDEVIGGEVVVVEEGDENSSSCCGLVPKAAGHSKQKYVKAADYEAFPVSAYPERMINGRWPDLLTKNNVQLVKSGGLKLSPTPDGFSTLPSVPDQRAPAMSPLSVMPPAPPSTVSEGAYRMPTYAAVNK